MDRSEEENEVAYTLAPEAVATATEESGDDNELRQQELQQQQQQQETIVGGAIEALSFEDKQVEIYLSYG